MNKEIPIGRFWEMPLWNVIHPSTVVDKGIQTWAPEFPLKVHQNACSHPLLSVISFPLFTELFLFPFVFFGFGQVTAMAAFKNPYTDNENNGLKYDFITEISPDVWKISRKSDRMEYLAQDITDIFFANADGDDWELTDYGHLLGPDGEDLIEKVKAVLNHPNLVSLVDSFALQFSSSGKFNRKRWFTVWDYCDAGNIGNLLVPPQPRPQDRPSSPKLESEDGDTRMEDAPPASGKQEDPQFLPESFCWHVLTSVLRALTWLHDGVRDVVLDEHGWKRLNEDLDWSPMLHRDITPQNIFIGYPRRREWYGPVKLGNYGRLFVSGHCQTAGDKHVPAFSKVIGPHPSQDVTPLQDLITLDTSWGSIYPYQVSLSS